MNVFIIAVLATTVTVLPVAALRVYQKRYAVAAAVAAGALIHAIAWIKIAAFALAVDGAQVLIPLLILFELFIVVMLMLPSID